MKPMIDKKKTGYNMRQLMDEKNISVKDVKEYLELGSVQSIYHWLNGIALPSTENLFALSILLEVPIDNLLFREEESA